MVTSSVDKLKAQGVTFVADVDKQAFQDSVKPVYAKYAAKWQPLIDRIQAVK
jgi:TRAP-type C4-dicarboxylate transport system substrate-binding protein